MSSDDLHRLRSFLFQEGYTIQNIELKVDGRSKPTKTENQGLLIEFGQDVSTETTFTLKKENEQIIFSSNERDVLLYGSTFHKSLDHDGNWTFQCYSNNECYYQTIDQLIDKDGIKRKSALERIAKGEFKPDYDPEKVIRKFLLAKNRKNKKNFEALRRDYFEILVNQALILNEHLKQDKKLQTERSGYAELSKLTREILDNGFKTNENLIKSFLAYHKFIDIDIDDISTIIQDQREYHQRIYGLFAKESPSTDIKIVGKAPLDVYRRYCELASHFINALRISVELGNGVEKIKPYKKFTENVEFLRSIKEYEVLVKAIEPRIRHSESHINTEICEKTATVRITEKKGKERIVLCEYPINEISTMILQLDRDFFPAMAISFMIFETFLLGRILDSFEYKILLLGIGNIK
jgi:hypothetical protein